MRTRNPLMLLLAAIGVLACTLLPVTGATAATTGSEDDVAAGYYRLLLEHTRWAETMWSPATAG
jgi:ABC-type cobalt transport system substrate-binding protein